MLSSFPSGQTTGIAFVSSSSSSQLIATETTRLCCRTKLVIFSFRLYRKSSLKVAQPTATTFLSRLRKTKDDDQSIRSGGSNQGNK